MSFSNQAMRSTLPDAETGVNPKQTDSIASKLEKSEKSIFVM
jgi:hypothetical protein